MRRSPRRLGAFCCLILSALVGPRALGAQSLTSGSLRGVIRANGEPLAGVQVTVEVSGSPIRNLESEGDGGFQIRLLAAGDYSILFELVGYQPVRRTGVRIAPGQRTEVSVLLVRRPPPIAAVEIQPETAVPTSATFGRFLAGSDIREVARSADVTDLGRGIPDFVGSFDRRLGLGIAGGGLPISMTRFVVDGIEETLLRHPAWAAEPVQTPIFAVEATDFAAVIGLPLDAEWRGGSGNTIGVHTRRGAGRFSFRPFGSFSSAKIGGAAADNPADSSTSSFQVGAILSGAIVPDTAHFFLRFNYRQLEEPAAYSWAGDSARSAGQTVSLRDVLPIIANDSFGTAIGPYVAPPVRTWKGGDGIARVDWRLGASQMLVARAGFASWKESGFSFGDDWVSGGGAGLTARDGSLALSLTSGGERSANEFRAGFSLARREYSAVALPQTTLTDPGLAFGSSLTLPGLFDRKTIDLSDAIQFRAGVHQFKLGVSATFVNHLQDYRFGTAGAFTFGTVDDFRRADGLFSQVSGPKEEARFATSSVGAFIEDTWLVAPDIQIQVGIRIDREKLPAGKVILNQGWQNVTGMANNTFKSPTTFAPRLGFVWDVQNRGEWILRGGGGVFQGRFDPAVFAEAILFDKDVKVRRGVAAFGGWPITTQNLSPEPQRLTILNSNVRPPRSIKLAGGITRHIGRTLLNLNGSYYHTDFLLRREDFNRSAAIGATQEGRPVYGTLVKRGGLVTVVPGSNRRFADFDLVSGLSPTGASDHYELTTLLEHRFSDQGVFSLSYAYSKTTDNMVGWRSADPTAQLSPLAVGVSGGDWAQGTSDFDVPHRAAATLRLQSRGSMPVGLTARYRVRSGLPFTPGFRSGIDANGDGSGDNDPAFLGGTLAGLDQAFAGASCRNSLSGTFAERNSCREKMAHGLDLGLSLRLNPGGGRGAVVVALDAFNVVSSTAGIVDRALVLIDPAGTLVSGAAAKVTLPLLANSHFGSFLIRRNDPRTVRLGLRLEY